LKFQHLSSLKLLNLSSRRFGPAEKPGPPNFRIARASRDAGADYGEIVDNKRKIFHKFAGRSQARGHTGGT
jgi:hypothetical protein